MNKWIVSFTLMLHLTGFAQYGYSAYGYANTGLQGSGYWGGQQNCGYQTGINSGASGKTQGQSQQTTKTDSRLAELKKDLAAKELEKKRAEKEMELAAKKLERVFDSEILDFLLEVHIEKGNTCADYKTFPANRCGQQVQSQTGSTVVAEGTVRADGSQVVGGGEPTVTKMVTADCDSKEDVPEKLQGKWTKEGGGYCNANSRSSGGSVSAAICNDTSLRNSDRKSLVQSSDCSKQLTNYRKNRIKRDEAQGKIEKIQDQIEDRQYAIADEKERASLEGQSRLSKTEADCEECAMMDRDGGKGGTQKSSSRDWVSTLGNIGVGLGLAYVGKQYDDRNAEYSAQLGYPPQSGYPTAVSLGLPFILNGIYGSVNGSTGQGSMGCGNSTGLAGMYGQGTSGAFGYPQSMYGQNPYGGGMYSQGYNPYMNGYGNMTGYGNMLNGYGNMTGTGYMQTGYGNMTGYGNIVNAGGIVNYGTMQGYGTMTNGYNNLNTNYQQQMAQLQYQQQMSQYQMQYYQQQYQTQMQQYQQQQQVATQGQQLQQEIYNLQLRLQNLYSGSYYNNGTSTSGLTATGGYYGTTYGTTYGSTTPPTWIPGSTSSVYTTPTYYNTTTTTTNGR